MFPKWVKVTIADENYSDIIDMPINQIDRKQSILSYNFSQKTSFFSHINAIDIEPMTAEFKLVEITAINNKGKVLSVVCDDQTEIGVWRGSYVKYLKVSELREASNIIVDSEGQLCKIVNIEPYYDKESIVYNIKSNKGCSKLVNGIMFKA